MYYLKLIIFVSFLCCSSVKAQITFSSNSFSKPLFEYYLDDPRNVKIHIQDTLQFIENLLCLYKNDNKLIPFRPLYMLLIKDTTFYSEYNIIYDTSMPRTVVSKSISALESKNFVVLFYIEALLIRRLNNSLVDLGFIRIMNTRDSSILYNGKKRDMDCLYRFYKKWIKKVRKSNMSLAQVRTANFFPLSNEKYKWRIGYCEIVKGDWRCFNKVDG